MLFSSIMEDVFLYNDDPAVGMNDVWAEFLEKHPNSKGREFYHYGCMRESYAVYEA